MKSWDGISRQWTLHVQLSGGGSHRYSDAGKRSLATKQDPVSFDVIFQSVTFGELVIFVVSGPDDKSGVMTQPADILTCLEPHRFEVKS
jgi:hypothetical protein